MTKQRFQGTGTALVTPFTADGSLDETALVRLVDFQLANGVDMLLPCGTTGESPSLVEGEWERVVSCVLDRVDGRVPVIVGAGSNSTAHAIRLTKRAEQLGADGVLSVGPYYNKPPQEGYYQHFKSIAEAADLPVILYNVPSRTGSNIRAETTLRLAEVPGVAGIKEASGDLEQVGEIIRNSPAGFRVLSGDDSLTLPMIALGGDGVVSVTSNEDPKRFSAMVTAALEGDFATARQLHHELIGLMRANFMESSPVPVKAILSMMGLIEEAYRLPLVPATDETRRRLRVIAEELGLLEGVTR